MTHSRLQESDRHPILNKSTDRKLSVVTSKTGSAKHKYENEGGSFEAEGGGSIKSPRSGSETSSCEDSDTDETEAEWDGFDPDAETEEAPKGEDDDSDDDEKPMFEDEKDENQAPPSFLSDPENFENKSGWQLYMNFEGISGYDIEMTEIRTSY